MGEAFPWGRSLAAWRRGGAGATRVGPVRTRACGAREGAGPGPGLTVGALRPITGQSPQTVSGRLWKRRGPGARHSRGAAELSGCRLGLSAARPSPRAYLCPQPPAAPRGRSLLRAVGPWVQRPRWSQALPRTGGLSGRSAGSLRTGGRGGQQAGRQGYPLPRAP